MKNKNHGGVLKLEKFLLHFYLHYSKFSTLAINFSEVWPGQILDLGKRFNLLIRLQNVLKISLQDALKISWRRLKDVFKTSWRRLEDVLKMSWRCLEDVSARRLKDVLKTSGRHLSKTSWKRLKQHKEQHKFRRPFYLERVEYWERFLKFKATGCGSISTVFSSIILMC